MKKFFLLAVAVAALATPAMAADLKMVKKAPEKGPEYPQWDAAFGAVLTSDYNFRGITQSNHKPAVIAYFEQRYNPWKDLQFYAGVGAASISFPNRAAAEVDFYAGVRPTFGALALDFGAWYYWYPGGQCFNAAQGGDCLTKPIPDHARPAGQRQRHQVEPELLGSLRQGSPDGERADRHRRRGVLLELGSEFGRRRHLRGRQHQVHRAEQRSAGRPRVLRLGRNRPLVPRHVGQLLLHRRRRTVHAMPFPNGIPYQSYTTWNLGIGFTKSVFTLDLRYYDTNLSDGDCNAFTSDQTARFTASFTPINIGGFGSNWCSSSFIVSGKFDLTALANLK